ARHLPAGQRCERLGLVAAALAKLLAIGARCRAGSVASPGMPDDVATLEALLIAGLLEHQVFGKVLRVVAEMEPGQRHGHTAGSSARNIIRDPEHPELPQLVRGERWRRAGIAEPH